MHILFTCLILLQAATVFAADDSCADRLAPREKRLLIRKLREASAIHLAPVPELKGTRFEKRLDDILYDDIAKELRRLSPERHDRIAYHIANARVVTTDTGLPHFDTTASFGPRYPIDLKYESYLEMTGALNDHALQRIYLRHETVHIRRLDAGDIDEESQRLFWVRNWILRKGALLWEERQAFLRQRYYLRRVFKRTDLPELKQLFPVEVPSEVEELKAMGVIFYEDEFRLIVNKSKLNDPVVREKYLKVARGKMNREFLYWVESALLMPKEEYVNEAFSKGGYRRFQRRVRRTRANWEFQLQMRGMSREDVDQLTATIRESWKK